MILREFLYLDENLLDQFLAHAEDGLYDVEHEKESHGGSARAGAHVSFGAAQAGAGGNRDNRSEVERDRRQVPESRFGRLYKILKTSEQLKVLEASTIQVYGRVDRRDVVEVNCYVDVPSIARVFADTGSLQEIAQLMSTLSPDSIADETSHVLETLDALKSHTTGAVVATGEFDAEEEPTLVFKLNRSSLRSQDVSSLEGDASVLGIVSNKWPDTECYPLLEIPGLNIFSRRERRKHQKQEKVKENGDATVQGPGVTLSVVAIYR